MKKIKIALLQLHAPNSVEEALEKGLVACKEAKKNNADIALFPELWSNGYKFFDPKNPSEKKHWLENALTDQSSFVCEHQDLAKELGMAIGLTYLEDQKEEPLNTFCLIDMNGKIVLSYSKVHIVAFSMEQYCASGNKFEVSTLETKVGPMKVGAMICFDREFPEPARVLALKEAELVLIPNCCIFDDHRIAQMKTRAFENKIALAMTNYPASHEEANGMSLIISPISFTHNESGQGKYKENLLLKTGPEEGIYYCELDLDEIREYQKNAIWGANFRHPNAYAEFVKEGTNRKFSPKKIIH